MLSNITPRNCNFGVQVRSMSMHNLITLSLSLKPKTITCVFEVWTVSPERALNSFKISSDLLKEFSSYAKTKFRSSAYADKSTWVLKTLYLFIMGHFLSLIRSTSKPITKSEGDNMSPCFVPRKIENAGSNLPAC